VLKEAKAAVAREGILTLRETVLNYRKLARTCLRGTVKPCLPAALCDDRQGGGEQIEQDVVLPNLLDCIQLAWVLVLSLEEGV
jgi:hypothetical protein